MPARRPAFANALLRAAALALLVAGLWYWVFTLTGLLWWNAPVGQRVAPPAPIVIKPPSTGWVDVPAYQRTHPVWRP
jgi:hypothetical protein